MLAIKQNRENENRIHFNPNKVAAFWLKNEILQSAISEFNENYGKEYVQMFHDVFEKNFSMRL